ncbi:MAG: glycosyl transferase family 6 [Verrucomicrobia bacterium TMED71]|nr:MAG: glycosyl transferase family 6 [Verrucomicrobia bacterium TMED71]
MKKKVSILYICTGHYKIFWKKFYKSAESYFLENLDYEKHYFVFTDADHIFGEQSKNIRKIYQKPLAWPYPTLDRFRIFKTIRDQLKGMDYIYHFNANMLFLEAVDEEILPTVEKPLLMVQHPGFYQKSRKDFTYEENDKSLAYIPADEGSVYVMGGLNGGLAKNYLELIYELDRRIEIDKTNNVIARWHDESHLNRYATNFESSVKLLDSSYGYPEGWNLPFSPKIIIRDKDNYGGHDFLRNKKCFREFIKKVYKW